MLYEVMRYIRNFFTTGEKITGQFQIEDGIISLPLLSGQYYLIEGSILNDGVYQYFEDKKDDTLSDEIFNGVISPLAIPKDFINLANEINEYCVKNPVGAYTSESFGGYSYSRATDSDGNIAPWQSAYRKRLDVYRKL